MTIALVTTNTNKVTEAQGCLAILGVASPLIGVSPAQEVDECGATFADNAQIKLEAALAGPLPEGLDWVVAEDSGLIVEALDGFEGLSPFPGVRSDRWLTEALQQRLLGSITPNPPYVFKNQALLRLMQDLPNRDAAYVACLAACHLPSGLRFFVHGHTPLWVATQPKGTNGFGYDPIMMPQTPDDPRTMGERSPQEKNRLSHRLKAWEAWAQQQP